MSLISKAVCAIASLLFVFLLQQPLAIAGLFPEPSPPIPNIETAAFPCLRHTGGTPCWICSQGLTKREYAAIQLTAALIMVHGQNRSPGRLSTRNAQAAIAIADYLFKSLENPETTD